MSKSNAFETALLQLVFNATAISSLASGSTTTSLWVALHTATPADTGDQSTNETSYTGYTRIAVARSTAGWSVASGSVSPAATISFPQATSTSTGTLTFASVGMSSSGAGYLLYYGALSPTINFGQNVTPQLSTASAITED